MVPAVIQGGLEGVEFGSPALPLPVEQFLRGGCVGEELDGSGGHMELAADRPPAEPGCQQFVDGRVLVAGAVSEAVSRPRRAREGFELLGSGQAGLDLAPGASRTPCVPISARTTALTWGNPKGTPPVVEGPSKVSPLLVESGRSNWVPSRASSRSPRHHAPGRGRCGERPGHLPEHGLLHVLPEPGSRLASRRPVHPCEGPAAGDTAAQYA